MINCLRQLNLRFAVIKWLYNFIRREHPSLKHLYLNTSTSCNFIYLNSKKKSTTADCKMYLNWHKGIEDSKRISIDKKMIHEDIKVSNGGQLIPCLQQYVICKLKKRLADNFTQISSQLLFEPATYLVLTYSP